MGFYLHNSSEGFTIVITIIYFVSAAKVVMVDGSQKISYDEILHGLETVKQNTKAQSIK